MSLIDQITGKTDDLKKTVNGREYWHYSLLSEWEKNKDLRILKEKDWLRLLRSIKRSGVKDPFAVDTNGTVYDGNHRLKALLELIGEGISEATNGTDLLFIPVAIHEVPKTEVEALTIAVEGNGDRDFATWNKDAVADHKELFEMVPDYQDYSFTFDDPVTFGDVFDNYEVEDESSNVQAVKEPKEVICPECSAKFVPK